MTVCTKHQCRYSNILEKLKAKILPNALNISPSVSIPSCNKLDFNMSAKIWLYALNISADAQTLFKNLLMIMLVGKYEFIHALNISEFT